MSRLCERPGCSAPAAVAYGMESERLLVWLALPGNVMPIRSGLLCRRHADAMIVPRGWTLDDRREAMPRLFRVADTAPRTLEDETGEHTAPAPADASNNHPSRGRGRARKGRTGDSPLQLVFEDAADNEIVVEVEDVVPADVPPSAPPSDEPSESGETPEMPVPTGLTVGDIRPLDSADPDQTKALPWKPVFDDDDDLGGLLKANSPLLSRAFRTRSAPPPEPS